MRISGLVFTLCMALVIPAAHAADETAPAPATPDAKAGMTVATPTPAKTDDKDAAKPAEKAEDAKPAPGLYAPDFCDFEITFPEAPYKAQHCTPDGKSCYELDSYTMVYDLKTTVDFSVTCNPSTPASFQRFNEAVIKAALAGMVETKHLANTTINFEEQKAKDTGAGDVRIGSLTGTGVTGTEQKIYTAQMWIGQNSVFTVQAELVGVSQEQADKSFSEILKSIKVKGGKQLPPAPEMPKQKTN